MRAAAAGALAGLLLAAAPAAAQIYRWTDGAGVVHLTTNPDSIPEEYRAGVHAVDASRPASEVPVPAARPPGTAVPSGGGPIVVDAELNGTAVNLIVDTGADRTLLSPAALARAGLDATAGRPVRIVGVTGGSEAREIVVSRLEVAGASLGPVPVIVHEVPAPGADGLLGRDLLDAFTLTVDGATGRATLTPR